MSEDWSVDHFRQPQEQEAHLNEILAVLQRVRCGMTDSHDAAFLAAELAVTQYEKTARKQDNNHGN